MEYIKLIVINVGDFSSSISYENNFGIYEVDAVTQLKTEMESKGYTCMMLKVYSNVTIKL